MKKAYVQPEIELLKVSALNEFLLGSPDDGIESGTGDEWLGTGDGNGNEFESEADGWF